MLFDLLLNLCVFGSEIQLYTINTGWIYYGMTPLGILHHESELRKMQAIS